MSSEPPAADVSRIDAERSHRPRSLRLLLVGSFVLFTGSFVLDQAFRWTNPMDGIRNGLIHIVVTGFAWVFVGLLPGLLIYGLFRWRGWRRFRDLAIISPGIAILVMTVVELILSPTTAAQRLKKKVGVELPASAREIRTHFTGGGMADYGDMYYFRCSAAETEALIKALGLGPSESDKEARFHYLRDSFPSWPDPSTWSGSTTWSGDSHGHPTREPDGGFWFYTLCTDASREQVYLWIDSM